MPLNDKDKDWIIDRLDSLEKKLRTSQTPIFKNSALNLGIKLGSNKNSEEDSKNTGILKAVLPKSKPLIGTGISNKKPNNDLSGTNQFTAKSLRGNTNSFVINNSGGICQNYILAKEAIFTDGTNNIMVSGMNNSNSSNSYAQKQKAEATKKHNNFITSTLKDLRSNSFDMAKTLKQMNLLTMLKFAGIASLLVGAAGIISWIKREGFGQVTKTILDGVHNIFTSIHLNKEGVEKAGKNSLNIHDKIANMNADTELRAADLLVDKNGITTSNTTDYLKGDYTMKNAGLLGAKALNEMSKKGIISESVGKSIKTNRSSGSYTRLLDYGKVTNFNSSSKVTKFSLPIAVRVEDADELGGEDGMIIYLSKQQKIGNKLTANLDAGLLGQNDPYANNDYIAVTGVVRLMVPVHTKIPANTIIALLGPNGQIIGDLQQFMKDENFDEYINKNTQDSTLIDENYRKFASKAGFAKKMGQTGLKLGKQEEAQLDLEHLKDNPITFAEKLSNQNSIIDEVDSSNVSNAVNQAKKAKPKSTTNDKSNNEPMIINQNSGNINPSKSSATITNFADPNPDATSRSSNRNAVIGT